MLPERHAPVLRTPCKDKVCPDSKMVNISIFECKDTPKPDCNYPLIRRYDEDKCCFVSICPTCTTSNLTLYQPGIWIQDGCQNCTCTLEGIPMCFAINCTNPTPPLCLKGYEPILVQDPNKCCPEFKCIFNETLCDHKPHYCKLGFNPDVPLGGCCTNFTCVPKPVCATDNAEYLPGSPVPAPPGSCEECICSDEIDSSTQLHQVKCNPIVCITTCDVGEEYITDPEKCCGECRQNACVFLLPNGTIVTLGAGQSLPLTDDICTNYVCTKVNGHFYSSISQIICEHSNAESCGPGEVYEKDPILCCGRCVQKQCVFTDKNGNTILVEAGHSVQSTDGCVTYSCKQIGGTLISSETDEICQYLSQKDCETGETYEPPPTGHCCGKCVKTSCVFINPDGTTQIVNEGQSQPSRSDVCVTYDCKMVEGTLSSIETQESCQYKTQKDCGAGETYQPPPAGKCCGTCVQTSCVLILPDGTIEILSVGESFPSSSDKCVTYNCQQSEGTVITTETQETCQYNSQRDCGAGEIYEPPLAGQCCGKCVQTSCVFILPDGTTQIVKEGDSVPSTFDQCVIYSCQLIEGTLISTETVKNCQYKSQSDCGPGETFELLFGDRCCGKCVKTSCAFVQPDGSILNVNEGPPVPSSFDNCVFYNCTMSAGSLISTETQKSCQYQTQKDCGVDETYEPPPAGQCCGKCVQTSCVFIKPDGTIQVVAAGTSEPSTSDVCVSYYCQLLDGTLISTENSEICQYQSQKDCGIGETYQPSLSGQCCGKCEQTSCVFILPNGQPKVVNVGQSDPSDFDKCVTYNCQLSAGTLISTEIHETCQYQSQRDCGAGETYEPPPADQCCGKCVQTSCVFILPDGTIQIVNEGDSEPSKADKCVTFNCKKLVAGTLISTETHEHCQYESQKDCGVGETYQPPLAGQCCGKCEKTSCVFILPNGATLIVNAGDSVTSPIDKCVTYHCQLLAGALISTETQKICQDNNQKDCGPGQTYIPPPADECCGKCVQTSCVFTLPDGTIQIVNEGQSVPSKFDSCVTYNCKKSASGTLTATENHEICQYQSQRDCNAIETYEPPLAGQCCGKCVQTSCLFIMPNGEKLILKAGESKISDDHCTTYTCSKVAGGGVLASSEKETCEVTSEKDCQIGFIFKKDPYECCGQCVQDLCVYVNSGGQVQTLKVGESKPDGKDPCITYRCDVVQGVFVTTTVQTYCEHANIQCQADEVFVKNPGQCCGCCVKVACMILDVGGKNRTLKVGSILPSPDDKCLSYGCMESKGLYYSVLYTKSCLPVNPADCESGVVELSSDGCCQICKAPKKCDVIFIPTTLYQGNCQAEVKVPCCSGVCPTTPVSTVSTTKNQCMCCDKKTSSKRTVKLNCPDGSTVPYTYENIDSCACRVCNL
ncbi:kielin/chordin-like protein [Hyperolius riggenbachi]|uniref:kielin/chordin-like protein n=1 Tax=Hyperolius riggenbachi TaxID=752182 RepID=UPI0035A2E4DB